MAKQLTLRDGTTAMIWPLLPTDGGALQEAYKKLSTESRRNRFLSAVPTLSGDMLRMLVDDVDCTDHLALVLTVYPETGPEQAAGVGRLIRSPREPTFADVAVTVADAWQGRGIGTALMTELLARRPAGVRELLTLVAASNTASLAMLGRQGALRSTLAGSGVLEVRVSLPDEERSTG